MKVEGRDGGRGGRRSERKVKYGLLLLRGHLGLNRGHSHRGGRRHVPPQLALARLRANLPSFDIFDLLTPRRSEVGETFEMVLFLDQQCFFETVVTRS